MQLLPMANQSEGFRARVQGTVKEYLGFFEPERGPEREREYARMINHYYDLVTDFYEHGWGDSFHFAPRARSESFESSIRRHQHYLALRLGLLPDMKVLDVGCGVGGPMRAIARFSGATIQGINNNDYQVQKAERYNRESGVGDRCSVIKGDFMAMPIEAAVYDAAYAIEATCHAPNRAACFQEVHRVLKPGALFAGYEWCMTASYNADNETHRAIKHGIEEGDGLPGLTPMSAVDEALRSAGFRVLESGDRAGNGDPETPWYLRLKGEGRLSAAALRTSPIGRFLMRNTIKALERVGVVPLGSTEVSAMLNRAAKALVAGGETGIFTPSYFFLAQKIDPAAN